MQLPVVSDIAAIAARRQSKRHSSPIQKTGLQRRLSEASKRTLPGISKVEERGWYITARSAVLERGVIEERQAGGELLPERGIRVGINPDLAKPVVCRVRITEGVLQYAQNGDFILPLAACSDTGLPAEKG